MQGRTQSHSSFPTFVSYLIKAEGDFATETFSTGWTKWKKQGNIRDNE